MILNLSIEEQIVQRAQEVAESRRTSLDQLVRQFLEAVASKAQPKQSAEEWIAELRRLTAEGRGHSQGWKFNREELYDRGSKD